MKIAIIKLSAMGDIIHTMVALQFIKNMNANIKIDWFVEKNFAGVLENSPDIDNIYTFNIKGIKKNKLTFFSEIKKLLKYRKNNYNLVIDAQGLLKSAIVAKILAKKILIGFDKYSIREKIASYFYNKKISIGYDKNTINRNITALCTGLDLTVYKEDILAKNIFLHYKEDEKLESYFKKDKKNIILVIGSTWESKNYPKEKFLEIVNKIPENFLIVWGDKQEKLRANWIVENSKNSILVEKTSLNDLKCLISKSDLLIGNDTGPTHMAWGLNIPSIVVFGPTPVNRMFFTDINKYVKSESKINPFKLNKNDFSIKNIECKKIIKIAEELL